MEAQINFLPKTKQLRKFKLFETKDVGLFLVPINRCVVVLSLGWFR